MEPSLRPDLGKILARPLPRTLADRGPPLGRSLVVPDSAATGDFLVDIDRQDDPLPGDAAFGLFSAESVAARVRDALAKAPSPVRAAVHRVDPARAAALPFA